VELHHQHRDHLARALSEAAPKSRDWLVAAVVVAALTAFRFWTSAQIGLAPDESYYWLWSRLPAAGYFDHPPMVAWWIWASTSLFGDTEFGVRALSVISSGVTSYAVFATARNLGLGDAIAARGAIWFNATILVGVGAILITPDSPLVMFWALAVWVLADIRRTATGWLWLLVGLFAGLGCLSKYTNFFLGVGVLLWLVLDREARRWFLSPWLWAGGIVAVVVFLPVFLWNADHNWISFAKQFGRVAAEGIQLQYVGEFIASQFGLLNPLIAVFIGLGVWFGLRSLTRRRSPSEGAIVFLLALCLPLIAYMAIHSIHARVQGNWLAPIYPGLALLAAIAAAGVSSRFLGGVAKAAAPVGIGVSVLVLLFFVSPLPTPFGQRTPAERLVGWSGLAERVEGVMEETGAGWIATADYGLTGELAFYGPGSGTVQQVDERQRYLFDTVDPSVTRSPALLVLLKERSDLRKFKRCFESIEPVSEIERVGPDGPVAVYGVWLAKGARKDILRRGCR
jgi:4-amino-4-deoxy-L-arabinose transferase-like glycosyltransferase